MDTKVKASTSLENDKDLFWAILSADPTAIAHHYGKELTLLANSKNKTKFHKRCDEVLTLVMNTVIDPMLVVAIVKCWLIKYKLPFEPDKMSSFDQFHERYGSLVIHQNRDIPII